MAIQNRRGNYSEFDPNQMVPGEFAVSLSEGNKRLFLCFARPGDVIEIPTVESIVDVHEIEEIRDEALEAKDAAQAYAEEAEAATITNVTATVDNQVGTPTVDVTQTSQSPKEFRFDFHKIKGETGVSIQDAYLNNQNHLILVYSDSTQAVPHEDDAGNVGTKMISLTQAEYDALTPAQKANPEIYYWITDATGGTYSIIVGGGGTYNYNELENKPSINGVPLTGNKTSADLGIVTGVDDYNDLDNIPTFSGYDIKGAVTLYSTVTTNTSSITIQPNSYYSHYINNPTRNKTVFIGMQGFDFKNNDVNVNVIVSSWHPATGMILLNLYNPTDTAITINYCAAYWLGIEMP